jgi:putative salt-induced outer membrane protein YdiY
MATEVSETPPAPPIHEIRTADGEVFRGELLEATPGRLVLRSKVAGELSFSPSEVVCLPPPMIEPAVALPAWVAAGPAPDPTAKPAASAPAASTAPAAPAAPVASAVAEASPAPAVPAAKAAPGRWRRSAEAGYAFQSSTVSKRDVYLRAETSYEAADRYRYHGLVKYVYGEQAGEKNSDRLEANAALRHDLATRWVFRGDLGYRNDHLRDLDLETSGFVGVQYLLFRHPRFRLSLGPGAGFRYRETDAGMLQGTRFNTDFVEEATWTITERISLTQNASFLYDTSEPKAYRVRNNAALSARLTERVRANLRYEYEFDRARPVGPSRVDQRIFTTLGVEF